MFNLMLGFAWLVESHFIAHTIEIRMLKTVLLLLLFSGSPVMHYFYFSCWRTASMLFNHEWVSDQYWKMYELAKFKFWALNISLLVLEVQMNYGW